MFDFNVTQDAGEVNVVLKGRLDATVAPQLHSEMDKMEGTDVKKVTFDVKDLEYIASAGLRVIIFTKQTAYTHLEELFEIGHKNGNETQAFKKRHCFIQCLFEHTLIISQP